MIGKVLQFHAQTLRAFVFTVIAADVVVSTRSAVVICIQHVHVNLEHLPEPHKFVLKPFLPGNKRHSFSYLPFSAYPRNCIGTFIQLSCSRFVILFSHLKYTTIFLLHQCVIMVITVKIRPTGTKCCGVTVL